MLEETFSKGINTSKGRLCHGIIQQPQVFNAAASGIHSVPTYCLLNATVTGTQCSSHRYSFCAYTLPPQFSCRRYSMKQLKVFNAAATGIQCSSHRYSMQQPLVSSAASTGSVPTHCLLNATSTGIQSSIHRCQFCAYTLPP